MISEAYVSFETAKLLKEKGFDVETEHKMWYVVKQFSTGCYWNSCTYKVGDITREYNDDCCILMPTQQMAMRWLREEYKLAINIRIACKKTISYVFDIWDFEIIHPNKFVGGTIDLREQQFDFKSYEEAAEAAIKYCLEYLI